MGTERRTFLKKAALTLLTLGFGETLQTSLGQQRWLSPKLNRYFQAMADPNARKLALLVGINKYPRGVTLNGCLTDVELQRELLIHRFGFQPKDILTLTDQQATRENIETAFVNHLIDQAKATDVVVFHFSGYGSQVKIPSDREEIFPRNTAIKPKKILNSLVPVDGILQTKGEPATNDLLEATLMLLVQSLATDKVTLILDTSYISTNQTLQGNLRVRACPNLPASRPSPEEIAFQKQVFFNLNPSEKKLVGNTIATPGMILCAGGHGEPAVEAQLDGFSTGLFTYALTQYLWQVTPASNIYVTLAHSAQTMSQIQGKQHYPQLIGTKPSTQESWLTYNLQPQKLLGAQGVISDVSDLGKTAQLHLGGLPVIVLEYYSPNSRFQLLSSLPQLNLAAASPVLPQVQVKDMDGITAKVRLVEQQGTENYQLQIGQTVQELVRVLPRNIGLAVAVESSMSRIERVDATSAFASIASVSSTVVAGEGKADCLLGRVKSTDSNQLGTKATAEKEATILGGYGLFSIARELIPDTVGVNTEAVKSAVKRVLPQLEALLAAKLLSLSVNEGSSNLGIKVNLERIDTQITTVMVKETLRRQKKSDLLLPESSYRGKTEIPRLTIGSEVQCRCENTSDQPCYVMLIGFDSSKNAVALYSPTQLQDMVVAPGDSITIPSSSSSFAWTISGPSGLAQVQVIFSTAPFKKTLAALEATGISKAKGERIIDLPNPLEVVRALLEDLHFASAVPSEVVGTAADIYALDVNAWASLNFVYQVI